MTTKGFVATHARDAAFTRCHSDDIEMLEIVLPAGFTTEEVPAVNDANPA